MFFVSLDDLILHRKTISSIYRAFFGHKVADMAVRGHDVKVLTQIFANCLSFGRRLNYDKILGHSLRLTQLKKNRRHCRG